jgi:hypothetical protein
MSAGESKTQEDKWVKEHMHGKHVQNMTMEISEI